jgi:hypothetical protein
VHENILDSHGKIIASFPQHSETTYHSYVWKATTSQKGPKCS